MLLIHFGSLVVFSTCFHVVTNRPNFARNSDGTDFAFTSRIDSRQALNSNNNNDENSSIYWIKQAQESLQKKLSQTLNLNVAKNVIFFVGDGLSITTLAATRIYKGQIEGKRGEDEKLFMEGFPHTGFSKTYCVDSQVPDSACTATAYLCGIKANQLTIGVNGKVAAKDCIGSENPENQVNSIASWAQDSGKVTGIVTTTTVTHASPAGNYAHTSYRFYESDGDIPSDQNQICQDIASQLIFGKTGSQLKVILGGGRGKFLPNTTKDEDNYYGNRKDGKNLIKHWLESRNGSSQYVWNRKGLININYDKIDNLLGLFNSKHMKFHLDSDGVDEPTLSEMTESAIKVLRKEHKGYYLFVEGGRIDHAHHFTQAQKALDETLEFDKAIQIAREMTSEEDTLIVVTSDHSHTMSISGYPQRGSNILGLSGILSDVDQLPFTTLSYANGPNYIRYSNGQRKNLSDINFASKEYKYSSMIPLSIETHGGDDVAVFASGPFSYIFDGVCEQNEIPHKLAFASCVGNGLTVCNRKELEDF